MKLSLFSWLPIRATARVTAPAAALILLASASSAANLVDNGNFEQLLVPGHSSEFGSLLPSQQVTGWQTTGYNFVFTPGTADTSGASSTYGAFNLWGPGNGSDNGLPATSPAGGNFLAFDGAFGVAPVTQTINGLTPGQATSVSFYWGAGQQYSYNSATTEQFKVSLGGVSQLTSVIANPNHGFTGWSQGVMSFIPTSSSELLSFLAIGTPNGVPPFALLDGVTVSNSPEPATWLLFGCSALLVGGVVLFRRRSLRASQN